MNIESPVAVHKKKTTRDGWLFYLVKRAPKGEMYMAQVAVHNLSFAYEGSFDNIFEDVSFSIDTNWKLGFIGRNGKGKSTFLNLLLGNYAYNGMSEGYSHFFNWFFVVRDPFYAIPETIAPFIMPLLNIVLFFVVEILLHLVICIAKRTKK